MASAQLASLYREARKANFGWIVGEHALSAWHAAKTLRKWEVLESMGAVRLRAESDDSYEPSDDDPDDTEAFGSIGEYRVLLDTTKWRPADSVWGHTGYRDVLDWKENPYIIDIMAETIDAFRDAWKAHVRKRRELASGICPTCHGTGRTS